MARCIFLARESGESAPNPRLLGDPVQSCLPSRGFLSDLRILSAYFPSKELRCVVVVLNLMLPQHGIRPVEEAQLPASKQPMLQLATRQFFVLDLLHYLRDLGPLLR